MSNTYVTINKGTGCQRQFELTFSPTTGVGNGCKESGGTDLYLAFIKDTVVPAVVAALGVVPGEMSMAGVSYGGLTSCYAAAAQPLQFRRVFCQSPSVNWNFGQLSGLVTANAAATVNRPLAVVAYVGTRLLPLTHFRVFWLTRVQIMTESPHYCTLESVASYLCNRIYADVRNIDGSSHS